MSLTPKNWKKFQHYSDRKPGWIKLHRDLLDDYAFVRLPLASQALAPRLWLLASEYEDGQITADVDEIAFRLHCTAVEVGDALEPLINAGFFIDDSETLAARYHDACLEKERETQVKTEKEKNSRAVAGATRPTKNLEFDEFWKVYPKRQGANPKHPARKKYEACVKSGVLAETIIGAARKYADDERALGHIGTPYVAQAVTWLSQQRFQDYVRDGPEIERQAELEQQMAAKGWHWNGEQWAKKEDISASE